MDASRKILSLPDLLRQRERARRDGRRVVHCHGCFDIVHPGHIRHLRFARAQGDVLLVTITADARIAKGDGRPLIPQELRAENLAELDCVDWVAIDEHESAFELLEAVRPDVYIKGAEYEFNHDPRFERERACVESHGGRVVFSSGDVVFSSSALIAAMEHAVDPYHKRLVELLGDDRLSLPTLGDTLSRMRDRRVVVVGETILDTYVLCDQPDVAGEGPMLTLRPIERRTYEGGAAIIARHAAALGARATLVTCLPDDARGDRVRARLRAEGVELRDLRVESALAGKVRYLVGQQKLFKVDEIAPMALDSSRRQALIDLARDAAAEGTDAAIIADFGLGMLGSAVTGPLCKALRPLVGVLAGDVSGRRASLRSMREMDLLCPSERELRETIGDFGIGLPAAAWRLMHLTRARNLLVTLGGEGLIAFEPSHDADASGWARRLRSFHLPALVPIAVDPLGCGDALLACTTLAMASGADLLQASFLGAACASREAQQLGNIPVDSASVRQAIARAHSAHLAFAASEPSLRAIDPSRFEPARRGRGEESVIERLGRAS